MAPKKKIKTIYSKTSAHPAYPASVASRAPKPPKLRLAHGDLVDQAGGEWLDQLTDVFDRTGPLAHMPLYEDQFPCPTSMAINTGTETVAISGSNTCINAWLTPCGAPVGAAAGDDLVDPLTSVAFADATVTNVKLGPILHPLTAGWECSPGVFKQIVGDTTPTEAFFTNTVTAFRYDPLVSPFSSGGTGAQGIQNGEQFRTAAFGIRVTFMGKLSDTEGYVECFQPAEYTDAVAGVHVKRDQAYRLNYFGTERSFTYYWTPNCDEVKFSMDTFDTVYSARYIPARMAIGVGGLVAGDKIRFDFVCIQEWAGRSAIATQVPRTLSVDAPHITNMLTLHRGAQHDETSIQGKKVPGKPLKQLTAGVKVVSTPWLKKAIAAAPGIISDAKYLATAAVQGAKVIAGLLA